MHLMKRVYISKNKIKRRSLFKKKKAKSFMLFTIFVLLMLFMYAGKFLVINEKAHKADAIVVLSGDNGRLEKAIELLEADYSDVLILSNGLAEELRVRESELSKEKSIIIEKKAESTYDSAVYVKKIMKDNKYKSAVIISSDYHMRRVKFNFSRVYKDSNTHFTFVSIDTKYHPNAWWLNKRDISITIGEYIKMIGNTFGVHGIEEKRKFYYFFEKYFE